MKEQRVLQNQKMTRFFKMLGAFIGDRKVSCDANYSDLQPREASMHIIENKHLKFWYGLDGEDFQGQSNNNTSNDMDVDQDMMIEMTLRDTDKTLIGPGIFNSLSICCNDINETAPYNFFKYALVNCPNLTYFEVSRLNMPKTKISAMRHGYYCREEIPDPSTRTQDNFKMIKLLDGITLDQGLLDLISAHLPNKEIVYQGNILGGHFIGSRNIVPKNININLTALKNLKIFNLDLNSLVPNDFERLFLHFKYTDGDEATILSRRKRVMMIRITEEERNMYLHQSLLKKSMIMKPVLRQLFDLSVWKLTKLQRSTCVTMVIAILLLNFKMCTSSYCSRLHRSFL